MSTSIFRDLISEYKTWPQLSEYLTSEAGGSLRVYDQSTSENPFAVVRYVKGKSDLSKPHVRVFRSVVWNTLENCPVSVTTFKSEDGETLPDSESTEGYTVERFLDGVMIGSFWDKYSNQWRIHTRSTLDATSRYYSQSSTFKDMFDEVFVKDLCDQMDKSCTYTWVLQHPENRVVVPVTKPTLTCVQKVKIEPDFAVTYDTETSSNLKMHMTFPNWDAVRARLSELNKQFKHSCQGLVVKDFQGKRWKVRCPEYNRVRQMRGNTARRDFLWLTMWRSGELRNYLALYPEEKYMSNMVIDYWKKITNEVYQFYTDVFKARTLQKAAIPPKHRPFVYGLHSMFMETLKPAGKVVVWKTVLDYMNGRDVPQMLFAINWDIRQNNLRMSRKEIPLEPPVTVGTEVASDSQVVRAVAESVLKTDDDMPALVPINA
jgi:hypothetical protein